MVEMKSVVILYGHHRAHVRIDPSGDYDALQQCVRSQFAELVNCDFSVCFSVGDGTNHGKVRPTNVRSVLSQTDITLAVVGGPHSIWEKLKLSQSRETVNIEPWLLDTATDLLSSACSRVSVGDEAVLQPSFRYGPTRLCKACATTCVEPSQCVAAAQTAPFACECAGRGMCLFSERYGAECGPSGAAPSGTPMAAAVRHTLTLQAGEQGRSAAQGKAGIQALLARGMSEARGDRDAASRMHRMAGRIMQGAEHMRQYRQQAFVDKALEVVPVVRLYKQAQEAFVRAAHPWPVDADPATLSTCQAWKWKEQLLRQLVPWFKGWFKWVNNAPCGTCGHTGTTGIGGAQPTPQEAVAGGAGMVEIYRCDAPSGCRAITRFPRYNAPLMLLESRQGRCGEWANAFTGLCLALGFDARKVDDWTDHVWTEVALPHRGPGGQMHVDACEAAVDAPLLYEAGWGKKLNYCIAHGLDHSVDVTRRYTHKWREVQWRRSDVKEEWLAELLTLVDAQQRATGGRPGAAPTGGSPIPPSRASSLQAWLDMEQVHMAHNVSWTPATAGPLLAMAHDSLALAPGDSRLEQSEQEAYAKRLEALLGPVPGAKPEELQGRISGSLEWRAVRGELGPGTQAGATATASTGVEYLSIAPADVVCAGWQAFRPALPLGEEGGWRYVPGLATGWGEHVLLVQQSEAGAQRVTVCDMARPTAPTGRALTILVAGAGGVWPPEACTIEAVAANTTFVAFWAITRNGSTVQLWRVTPAVEARWTAFLHGVVPLPSTDHTASASLTPTPTPASPLSLSLPMPMARVGEHDLLLCVHSQLMLLDTRDSGPDYVLPLTSLCPALGIRALATTPGGLVLGWQRVLGEEAVQGGSTDGQGQAGQVAERGHIVCLIHVSPGAVAPRGSSTQPCPPLSPSTAALLPLSQGTLSVQGGLQEGAAVALVRVGYPTESVGRHSLAFPTSSVPLGSHSAEALFDGLLCEGSRAPPSPGLYDIRVLRGRGNASLQLHTAVVGACPVVVLPLHAQAPLSAPALAHAQVASLPAWSWIPLMPAANVTALVYWASKEHPGVAALAFDGEGTSRCGMGLYGTVLPRACRREGIAAARARGLDLAPGTGEEGLAGREQQISVAARQCVPFAYDRPVVPPAAAREAEGPVATAASLPHAQAGASEAGAQQAQQKALFERLFKQMTHGCGKPAGACSNVDCAACPAFAHAVVGTGAGGQGLNPTQAAAKALLLLAGKGASALCP